MEMEAVASVRKCRRRRGSDDIHAAAFLVEEHAAIDEGEERVVPAAADAEESMLGQGRP